VTQIAALEERLLRSAGKLPVVREWRAESVFYQSELAAHEGSLWQARKDTAQVPGGSDWVCVARSGRDATLPRVRGTFDSTLKYKKLDVVQFDASSYVASNDDPGIPGSNGWQLLASRGRRGEQGARGERGAKGDRGETGATLVSWHVDREKYRATPFMSDGSLGPDLQLRSLFEQFQSETS
jgi:hypothetical protein